MTKIIGIMLVCNEDIYVAQALRSAIPFCDRILVLDNYSIDGTAKIIHDIASGQSNIEYIKVADPHDTQKYISDYAGSDTWIFGVDGDEIYDTAGLLALRAEILSGRHSATWNVYGSVIHAVALDCVRATVRGFVTPASRSMTKLYNFSLLKSWDQKSERLHGRKAVFKDGIEAPPSDRLYQREGWEAARFRCMHTCFLKRSTHDFDRQMALVTEAGEELTVWVRSNPNEIASTRMQRPDWKLEKYAKGKLVEVSAAPFLPAERDTCT